MLVIAPDEEISNSSTSLASTQMVGASSVSTSLSAEAEGVAQKAEEKPKVPERVYPLYDWSTIAPYTNLHYITDLAAAEAALARFQPGLVGFDLEWKPNWRRGQQENPVALVQLANKETILLLQITAMRCVPIGLERILWDSAYVKAGVGIQGDCKKLWNDWRVNVRNCVDLALLARTVDNARWKGKYNQPIGLSRLCETYKELTLNKGKITRSNWEARLSPQQQLYAANDSHSGLTLLQHLLPMVETTVPAPLPTYYTFDLFEGLAYEASADHLPQEPWVPENPNYDPGPPPEPKPPKEKKDGDKEKARRPPQGQQGDQAAATASGGTAAASAARRPRNPRNAETSGGTFGPTRGRGHHPRGSQVYRGGSHSSHQYYHPEQRVEPVTVSLGFLAIAPTLHGDAAQNHRPAAGPSNRGHTRGGRNYRSRGQGGHYSQYGSVPPTQRS